jgi:fructose-bisphosphate aldolase class I
VAKGKGILAAGGTAAMLTQRLEPIGPSTEDSRQTHREMLFTAPEIGEFVSGVIMRDETIRQIGSSGAPLAQPLADQGIVSGIKVDTGTSASILRRP